MNKNYLKLFLTIAVALIVVFSIGNVQPVEAFPAMSPDGVTCTPCHEEGFTGEHEENGATEESGTSNELAELHPIFNLKTKGLYIARFVEWDEAWSIAPEMPVYSYPTGSSPWDDAWK